MAFALMVAPAAQATDLVMVTAGDELEVAFAAELQLASTELGIHMQDADADWAGLTAVDQAERVRTWVEEQEADAALWLTLPAELHLWVPSADRDLVIAVRATTDSPAGELALVALQHLRELGWSEPAPAPPPPPPVAVPTIEPRDRWAVSLGPDLAGDFSGSPTSGPRLGGRIRWASAGTWIVPQVDLAVRTPISNSSDLEIRGDGEVDLGLGLWVQKSGLGPSLSARMGARRLSAAAPGDDAEVAGWLAPAIAPGLRVEAGGDHVRIGLWTELPIGLRARHCIDDQHRMWMAMSAVQGTAGLGVSLVRIK